MYKHLSLVMCAAGERFEIFINHIGNLPSFPFLSLVFNYALPCMHPISKLIMLLLVNDDKYYVTLIK